MFSLLRGSGLKFEKAFENANKPLVLPLTREWIEMPIYLKNAAVFAVLPLTREWIEIAIGQKKYFVS